ncbi:hypothetical protein [Gordonia sihwensis]|nr:hypothetical protein [Gordonia sihwensis]WFN93459.1 hypothetical protein P5P27_02475 [Gordonia sihwensis]
MIAVRLFGHELVALELCWDDGDSDGVDAALSSDTTPVGFALMGDDG